MTHCTSKNTHNIDTTTTQIMTKICLFWLYYNKLLQMIEFQGISKNNVKPKGFSSLCY